MMIRILDSFISDKIAAGEVIERPVSAIKELIENSIDAGASSIIVEIRGGGGNSYIRITDDGSGISSDEIETAFLRHATSKISTVSDLDNIQSLGFRGEALASISAVSRLTIVSRTADEQTGTKMILHAGKVISKEKIGSNKGTSIIVEDLFYNTPARRKFMKSDAREASAITELVQQYAIFYSDIRFMMINNGSTVFTTGGSGDSKSTVKSLYPDNAHSALIDVDGRGVRGFVSDPGSTLSSRKGQLFFVNGRLVTSKTIEKALTDAYSGRIFSGHPVAILFIDEDPAALDVNIHPGKREILFLHADDISERIKSAVSNALNSKESIPNPSIRSFASSDDYTDKRHFSNAEYISPAADTAAAAKVSEQQDIKKYLASLDRDNSAFDNSPGDSDPDVKDIDAAGDLSASLKLDELVFRGYVFSTYIITESDDTLYVFDQHAAHERIFYEKLLGVYNSGEKLSQPILSPIMVNVSADVYQIKDEILDFIASLGYDISDFGSGSFIIREIPSFMSAAEAEEFVNAFCTSSDIESGINQRVVDKLIMKSCKAAVKGGDRLSEMEIKELLRELAACDNPYSCPHGRPTFIKITRYDVERSFRRI